MIDIWTDITKILLKIKSKTVTVQPQDAKTACNSRIGFGSIKHTKKRSKPFVNENTVYENANTIFYWYLQQEI